MYTPNLIDEKNIAQSQIEIIDSDYVYSIIVSSKEQMLNDNGLRNLFNLNRDSNT